jgi:hypothetical protein
MRETTPKVQRFKEKAQGGLFFTVVDRESYPGIGYNKNAIRESDVAKSFDDLLKPALRGKIGVAALAHTQHPHTALLFIDFLIGPQGQKLFSDKLGYGSPRKNYEFKRWYPEQGLTTYEYAETIERWNKLLLEISRK